MERKNNHPLEHNPQPGRQEHTLPNEISTKEKDQSLAAHNEAEKDMENDVELSAQSPNDDLDEGESARLGEDKTDLV